MIKFKFEKDTDYIYFNNEDELALHLRQHGVDEDCVCSNEFIVNESHSVGEWEYVLDKEWTEEITINKVELASELAHQKLVNEWTESVQIYEDDEAGITHYTEEAQDIFNELYDSYLTLIQSTKI